MLPSSEEVWMSIRTVIYPELEEMEDDVDDYNN